VNSTKMGRGISCDGSTMINPVAVNEDRASKCPEEAIAGPTGHLSHPTAAASASCASSAALPGSSLIHQLCPIVMPQPGAVNGSTPEERAGRWTSRRLWRAYGKPVALDWVWTLRPLRPVRPEEYAFGIGRLRRWP